MLATSDYFLLDDNLPPTSPPLKAIQVRAEPSPEPSFLPPPASVSSDENLQSTQQQSRRRRRRRTVAEAVLGDAVLIDQLGSGNHPELASNAGQRPLELARSTSNTTDEEMEVMERPLMKMAADASKLADTHDRFGSDTSGQFVDRSQQQLIRGRSPSRLASNPKELHITTKQRTPSAVERIHPHLPPHESRKRKNSSQDRSRSHSSLAALDTDSIATSPNHRQFAIPASQGSPLETPPALQKSPLSTSKSPSIPPSLPWIFSQSDPMTRHPLSAPSNAPGPNHSPPRVSAPAYAPLQPRSAGTATSFPPINLSAAESLPATTHRSTSPRDQYRTPYDPTSMSPPSAHSFRAPSYHTTGTGPVPREIRTPLSGESSQPSTSGFSGKTWPGSERMGNMDSERPTLPALGQGGAMSVPSFRCEYSGCKALPFGTQYLLNSHANVHSKIRSHYCPVITCPRSEGGKGFKRKNEMIRHGLVHQSPGYICPYCQKREHRYPRPDNLQRHVHAHHHDKDKDDPQLREVLAQRPEGGSRERRRRVGS